MAALVPVIETLARVQLYTFTDADERESGWSLMARVAQASQQRDSTFRLTFDEATKRLTVSAGSTFPMYLTGAESLTGFATVNTGASTYTGAALSTVLTVDGVRMAPPGWSTGGGKAVSDGSGVSSPRWQTGSVSIALSVNYADAFTTLKTIRAGVWDVVNEGIWLGRIRVTGASLEPQGRLPGIVEARINGVAVP